MWSLQEPVLSQALCTAVAGPALLKTVLKFFSSSEAGLAADPAVCEVAPGADLWWGPESKRPRNHSGNEDPQAPYGCYGGRPPYLCPRLRALRLGTDIRCYGSLGDLPAPLHPSFGIGKTAGSSEAPKREPHA